MKPIITIIIILLILTTSRHLTDNLLIRNLIGYIFVYVLIKCLNKKISEIKVIAISLVIILALEIFDKFLCNDVETIETFENVDELIEQLDKLKKDVKKGSVKKNKEEFDETEIEEDEIEDSDIDNDYNDPSKKILNKKIKEYTPQEAQKESFRLLNTVRELKQTVDTLVPALGSAKEVLDVYKNLRV